MSFLIGCLAALFMQDKPEEQAFKKLTEELPKLIKAADADGNGTLKRAEFTAFEAAVRKAADAYLNEIDPSIAKKKAEKNLKKYDVDGDGKLDEAETKASEAAKAAKEIRDFDWDEDGKLNEREKQAKQWAEEGRLDGAFRRIDTDGKGELTQEQLAAAIGEMSKLVKKK